jgi:hypothetical protein
MRLGDDLVKCLRPPFPRQYLIGHLCSHPKTCLQPTHFARSRYHFYAGRGGVGGSIRNSAAVRPVYILLTQRLAGFWMTPPVIFNKL